MHVFDLEITDAVDGKYLIHISNHTREAFLWFSPEYKSIEILPDNSLTDFLTSHTGQLRRLLHNKRLSTFYKGFKLRFCIQSQKDMAAFADRSRIIVLDRRQGEYHIYPHEQSPPALVEVFCDGSLVQHTGVGGIAIVIKSPDGKYQLESCEVSESKSCQIELLAAIKGLQITAGEPCVRIVSDSLYVRKGLTEWIIHWRLNNWNTIQGTKVKSRENWLQFDALSQNRYLEFQWIKSKSGHFEQSLADLYAKDITKVQT